jgi:hypothetical protein
MEAIPLLRVEPASRCVSGTAVVSTSSPATGVPDRVVDTLPLIPCVTLAKTVAAVRGAGVSFSAPCSSDEGFSTAPGLCGTLLSAAWAGQSSAACTVVFKLSVSHCQWLKTGKIVPFFFRLQAQLGLEIARSKSCANKRERETITLFKPFGTKTVLTCFAR